ncbi:hypothetical protein B566_EDAN011971 [Ephemera danica]|nr:hypothetical protein B566_EDAN011971 [Ephemera danica]
MMPVKDNEDESCFLVTKLSPWRGRCDYLQSQYSRNHKQMAILRICGCLARTKFKPYPAGLGGEFTISARSKKSSMRFSCEYRADLITDLLTHRHQFCGAEKQRDPSASYSASKVHWLSVSLPATLQVAPAALEQRDPTTNALVASYNYKDLAGMRKSLGLVGALMLAANAASTYIMAKYQEEDIDDDFEVKSKARRFIRRFTLEASNL